MDQIIEHELKKQVFYSLDMLAIANRCDLDMIYRGADHFQVSLQCVMMRLIELEQGEWPSYFLSGWKRRQKNRFDREWYIPLKRRGGPKVPYKVRPGDTVYDMLEYRLYNYDIETLHKFIRFSQKATLITILPISSLD